MIIRCPSRIHGVVEDGKLEVKCPSKRCGAGNGVLVFHYFDPFTGELVETRKYRDAEELQRVQTKTPARR